MIIFEIALGILAGYLLIKSLPYVTVLLVYIWSFKFSIFPVLLTIVGYIIFFTIGLTEGFKSLLVMSAGLIGLSSLFVSMYSFDSEEENKSMKGFLRWLRRQ